MTDPALGDGPDGAPVARPVVPDLMPPEPLVPPIEPAARSPFADIRLTPRRMVPAAFDLLARSERDLRGASFYVGFLTLTTIGPAAALLWALQIRFGDGLQDALAGEEASVAGILIIVAALGFIVAAIESRTLAVAVLGGRLEGRPLTVGGAVVLARRRFWRALGAGFLVGLLTGIANVIVQAVVTEPQVAFVVTLLVGVLVEAPFVYAIAGIVLGEAGIGMALGRSTRLFRARKGLAVTVSLFGIASQFVLLLALFAGLDVVIRVIDAIGLDPQSALSAFVGTVLVGVLLFALGTLLFTSAALAAAPQVLAFTGLTHYARGLEAGRAPVREGWPWDPFVTRPLAAGIGVALLFLFGGIWMLR